MTQAGSVLVVDDQADRASALVAALDDPHHRYEITPETPDIEAVLGPDSPWDCVICHVELLNVSWASVRRVMRNFDVQVPVLAVSDHRDIDSMTTALGLGAASFFVNPAEKPGLVRRAIERSGTRLREPGRSACRADARSAWTAAEMRAALEKAKR